MDSETRHFLERIEKKLDQVISLIELPEFSTTDLNALKR